MDQRNLQRAAIALKAEVDGKTLRSELMRDLRRVADPLVQELKSSIETAPTHSAFLGEPLRQGIADKIKPIVRLTGRSTGVSIRAMKTPGIRRFSGAARAFNKPGFRHRVFGKNVWVPQVGKPGWFDRTTEAKKEEFATAVRSAVEALAKRIADRSRE